MTDRTEVLSLNSTSSTLLREVMEKCTNFQSYESLPLEDYNDVFIPSELTGDIYIDNLPIMISPDKYSVSSTVSAGSFVRDECRPDEIVEVDEGRLSLAYESLKNIPRQIAEKFAPNIKHLDLSYNNFRNLSFLECFKNLDTLILDRNTRLDVTTFPILPNLKILWINNCDIKNVLDWIQCVRIKCANLIQLSIMGNPGIKEPFKYYSHNKNIQTAPPSLYANFGRQSAMLSKLVITDYRAYILEMLPHLQYLDGSERSAILDGPTNRNNNVSSTSSPTPSTSSSLYAHNNNKRNMNDNEKSSTSLSFKDLFRFKRHKVSYPSSSTT